MKCYSLILNSFLLFVCCLLAEMKANDLQPVKISIPRSIPSSQAPKSNCTRPNEVWTECGNNSCQRNCRTFGNKNLACRPICTPGCICNRGFIRNAKGICVHPLKCENNVCYAKNEMFSECVSPCGERCSNLGQKITCNFLVCNMGCDCKPGFFKNSRDECVPPSQCDCPENSELILCNNPCPPETCATIGARFKCAAVDPNTCRPACKCKRNYKRDSDGNCVHISQCPPLPCGKNEEFAFCPEKCSDRCGDSDEICTDISDPNHICNAKCTCKAGFCRNAQNMCVPVKPSQICKGRNEVWTKCDNNSCLRDCETYKLTNLACRPICTPGCICQKGYLRNKKGECVLISDCDDSQ